MCNKHNGELERLLSIADLLLVLKITTLFLISRSNWLQKSRACAFTLFVLWSRNALPITPTSYPKVQNLARGMSSTRKSLGQKTGFEIDASSGTSPLFFDLDFFDLELKTSRGPFFEAPFSTSAVNSHDLRGWPIKPWMKMMLSC